MAPALAELNDSGTVGIIGFAFVRKETGGSASVVEAGDTEQAMVGQAASQTAAQFHAQQAAPLAAQPLQRRRTAWPRSKNVAR